MKINFKTGVMRKLALTIAFSLIASCTIFAQYTNTELLKKLVEKDVLTQAEADEIAQESANKDTSKAQKLEADYLKSKELFNSKFLQLGGYAHLHYSYNNTQRVKNDLAVRNAYLSIKGEPIDKLSYAVLFSMHNAELTEYNISWAPLEQLQFRIGQQKTVITIENQISASALELIQNARVISALVGGTDDVLSLQNGRGNGGRDIGIKMHGDLFKTKGKSFVEYAIGLYQGTGINTSSLRNNKDFMANILISPFEGLRLGGGFTFGEAVYSIDDFSPREVHGRNRWLLSADYQTKRFSTRAEYIKGNDSSIEKEGLYGMARYFIKPEKWILLGRVGYYNDNKTINKEVMDYSVGLTYHVTETCRMQANYTYSDYSKIWNQKDSHIVEAQFQIVF